MQRLSILVQRDIRPCWETGNRWRFPERQAYRGNAQEVPVLVQLIITKNLSLFPFSIPSLFKCKTDFLTRYRHAHHLLYLVPSIILDNTMKLPQETEGMLFCETVLSFPKFLEKKLRRWETMWQSAEKKLPSNLLLVLGACDMDAFPNKHRLFLIAYTLPISSADAERSFLLIKRIRPAPDQRCLKSAFWISQLLLCITPRYSK